MVLLGIGGVGKSCLTMHFCQNIFVSEYDPTIENLYRRQVKMETGTCVLEILDTAGQEEFSVMRDQYIHSGDGFMLVYSIDDRLSFDTIPELRDAVSRVKENDTAPIVIVGAKSDLELERAVATFEGVKLAKSFKCPFVESSSKTGTRVEDAFRSLVEQIREKEAAQNAGISPRKKRKSSSKCTIL